MNVVVIDNDAALLRSLEILLSAQGHRVRSFNTQAAACSFIERGAPLDVLILEYVMASMEGGEFLGRIMEHLPQTCKVILISSHTDLVESLSLEAMGVAAFLPKPLDFDKLCGLVG